MADYFILGFAAIIGMTSGAASLLIEHPLDVIKTYWQAHPGKLGVLSVILAIRTRKGWRGFYAGAVPNMLRVIVKQAYRYPLMIALPLLFSSITSSVLIISIATGLSIAVIEVGVITPLERFKVWLMTYQRFSGGVRTFIKEVRGDVVHTLYKGLSVTMLRQVVSWVTFLGVHDQLMVWVKSDVGRASNMSVLMLLVVVLIEGAINTGATLPFDCIKTHQQKMNANDNDRMIIRLRWIYHRYGIRGLYVGWQVRIVQYMVHAAFTVMTLERLKDKLL